MAFAELGSQQVQSVDRLIEGRADIAVRLCVSQRHELVNHYGDLADDFGVSVKVLVHALPAFLSRRASCCHSYATGTATGQKRNEREQFAAGCGLRLSSRHGIGATGLRTLPSSVLRLYRSSAEPRFSVASRRKPAHKKKPAPALAAAGGEVSKKKRAERAGLPEGRPSRRKHTGV